MTAAEFFVYDTMTEGGIDSSVQGIPTTPRSGPLEVGTREWEEVS